MNPFDHDSAAERYARGRPYFHPFIIEHVGRRLGISRRLPRALDVGCGVGLSTVALRELAGRVVGVDASRAMLAQAPRGAGADFCAAAAERLPFAGGSFTLLTLSQVFHWLDRGRFMAEARRVLGPGGWLVVYDNYFTWRVEGGEPIEGRRAAYLAKYPPPARAPLEFDDEAADREGFRLCVSERLTNALPLAPEEVVALLMSQSNVAAAVEGGRESADEARRWLRGHVEPSFGGARTARFVFESPVWCLRRAA